MNEMGMMMSPMKMNIMLNEYMNVFQDERNQIISTNVWVRQVSFNNVSDYYIFNK